MHHSINASSEALTSLSWCLSAPIVSWSVSTMTWSKSTLPLSKVILLGVPYSSTINASLFGIMLWAIGHRPGTTSTCPGCIMGNLVLIKTLKATMQTICLFFARTTVVNAMLNHDVYCLWSTSPAAVRIVYRSGVASS